MIVYYSRYAKETALESAVCCISKSKHGDIYYIKSNKTLLYDPNHINSSDWKIKWEFKKVSEEVFNHYMEFLKTGSVKHKHFAERLL